MSLLWAVVLAAAVDGGVAAPSAPFSWDVPGQVQLVPVGSRLERDGLPIAIFLAKSSWDLDRLLVHYAQRFADAGYFIPPRMGRLPGLKLPRVVALDDQKMVSFLVYGWPEPDGTTTLVLGASDLAHRKPREANGLPVFPAATRVTSFDIELARALSFTAKATEAEVIDFYRSVLPSDGWREREAGTFVKDGRAVRVLARAAKALPALDGGRAAATLDVVVLEQNDAAPVPGP
ncbi:MAG: hypothetical protein U0228_18215 [Myxococcaceae bacterium]